MWDSCEWPGTARMHVFRIHAQIDCPNANRGDRPAHKFRVAPESVVVDGDLFKGIPCDVEVVMEDTLAGAFEAGTTNEQIIDAIQNIGSCGRPQKNAAVGQAVHQGVVDQIDLIARPFQALGTEPDDMHVVGSRSLFDDVPHHVGDTAVRELQFVTCRATRLVCQAVVKNVAHGSPAL